MYDKTLMELKKAIEQNKPSSVSFYASTLFNRKLEGEFIDLALNTQNPSIVKTIAPLTEVKDFDRNILLKAIGSQNEKIVKEIIPRTADIHFDKRILELSILTNNGEIASEVAKKSHPSFFDEHILHTALRSRVPDSVRAVVDRVTNIAILTKNKGAIQEGILRGEDLKNLAGQMLSRSSNQSYDREMQDVVFDIYLDVIMSHLKKGDISQNFPIKNFADSIHQSRHFAYSPFDIDFKSLDTPNRFLILPVFSYGHAFSAVVKKENDSNNISITFVNLGARPFEVSGKGNQYKEFVYTPENAKQILQHFCYNIRVDYPKMAVSTEQAYKKFKKFSLEEYSVNVTSRDQKVGNCFTKNIEKGLRYALAIGLSKSEDKEFTQDSLRVVKKSDQKQKVKFLKPIYTDSQREFSDELLTVKLRKELINAMIKRFPEYEKEIMEEWDIYANRKEKTQEKPEDRYTMKHTRTKLRSFENNQFFDMRSNSKSNAKGLTI